MTKNGNFPYESVTPGQAPLQTGNAALENLSIRFRGRQRQNVQGLAGQVQGLGIVTGVVFMPFGQLDKGKNIVRSPGDHLFPDFHSLGPFTRPFMD
jgi:hypothetical protein